MRQNLDLRSALTSLRKEGSKFDVPKDRPGNRILAKAKCTDSLV